MPFIGSVPPPVRSIVHEHTRSWEVDDLYIACSGNLTIERAADERFRLHSSDVSIYTSMIGSHFAGAEVAAAVKPEHVDEWGWLDEYLATQADRAATAMLGTSAFQHLHRDTPFHLRQRVAYREQWPDLHAKTKEKLGALTLKLASYTPCDAAEFVHTIPADAAALSFPPFYEGGYETLYAGLDELLEWDAPSYQVMDRDGLDEMLDVMEGKAFWLYGTDHLRPDREKYLRGVVQVSSRNVPIYVYSSHGSTRWTGPKQNVEPLKVPRLGPGEGLGEELALGRLSAGQLNALRAQYLDPKIAPAGAMLPLGVFAGGALVGVFAFNRDQYGGGASAYLLSDFAVAPTDYPRLSKLVLYAALSREAQLLAERTIGRRIRTITTTAFSNRPSSGKYRGLFKLTKRTETPDAPHRYQLQYAADAGRWTMAEGFSMWREKHGQA